MTGNTLLPAHVKFSYKLVCRLYEKQNVEVRNCCVTGGLCDGQFFGWDQLAGNQLGIQEVTVKANPRTLNALF